MWMKSVGRGVSICQQAADMTHEQAQSQCHDISDEDMDKSLTGGKGKAKADSPEEKPREGKTARAPKVHATRTNATHPNIVTNVPAHLYKTFCQ